MIPAGYGEIVVAHTGGGIVGEGIWTIGFDNNAGSTAAEIAEDIDNGLVALDYMDCLSSSVTVSEVRVKLGPDATGPLAVRSLGYAGTIGGNAAPPNVAALVHKVTPLGGRQGRGRLFVPGLSETALGNGGSFDIGVRSLLQTFMTAFGNLMTLGSLPLMLLHGDALTPTAISNLDVDSTLATQRRRLRR